MADIRQDTGIKDTFERADEDPLSGGGNWAQTDTASWYLRLQNDTATSRAGIDIGNSYWTPDTYDGDEAECWGCCEGGGASGIRWGVGLFTSVGGSNQQDGYLFSLANAAVGGYYDLHRMLNGALGTLLANGGDPPVANPGILLIRRNGNDVEGWLSEDNGATWTMHLSATDTTHMTGFSLGLRITDESGTSLLGFTCFGGGGHTNRPQIYRWISN